MIVIPRSRPVTHCYYGPMRYLSHAWHNHDHDRAKVFVFVVETYALLLEIVADDSKVEVPQEHSTDVALITPH